MKKKVLSIALTLSMIATFMPIIAIAERGTKYGDYLYYEMNKDNTTVTITDCDSSARTVEIPSEIENLPVTSIGDRAFENCGSLYRITIPESITSIGEMAFYQCTQLAWLTIPKSVTYIGSNAFSYCKKLTDTDITIPESVTHIGKRVFMSCTALTSINVDDKNPNYTSIDGVLYNKTSKELVEYPYGKAGTSYSIPDGTASIGEDAFSRCPVLTDITIPKSVTAIGRNAFSRCMVLASINVDAENPSYTSIDGVLYNKTATELVKYPCKKEDTSYAVYDSVISIGDSSFRDCRNLTSISISDKVTNIGSAAFSYCYGLKNISIPESVTVILNNAFYSCSRLTDVYYGGTYEQWKAIDIGVNNDELTSSYTVKHYKEVTPTVSPTTSPTGTPTIEPTATPTIEPTATPTVEPTPTPTPTPDFAFGDILKYHDGRYIVEFEKNTDKKAYLILAVYSENALIAVDYEPLDSEYNGNYAEFIGNYKVSDDIKYVKVLAWDEHMSPLCGAKTFLDKDIAYSHMD